MKRNCYVSFFADNNQIQMIKEQTNKQALSFWQLWNMSFGFFGIQYGWTLQIANTSAIYEYLGADAEQIPILWLAAPLSGLIAQPIIGYFSDRTWTCIGRRRPYFLIGAILSSIALVLMPNSASLWMAAGLLWILDTSFNISMEPFRAFVVDLLPKHQITKGFTIQGFFIGFGSVVASLTPFCLNNFLGIENISTSENSIPLTVKISFYLGAIILLFTVLWTIVTTKEKPPNNLSIPSKQTKKSLIVVWQEIFLLLKKMPNTMKQLAGVQFFTWLGMFCVFLYFPTAVAHHIFGAVAENSQLYTDGIEWAGFCIAIYNAVCFIFSWFIPKIVRATSRKRTHCFCLLCGGLSTISLLLIHNQYLMLIPMIGFGIAWASILSIPYAILSESLKPKNMGFYLGIFNAFIVIPQIVAALALGWVMVNYLHGDRLLAVALGGVSLILAAFLVSGIEDTTVDSQTNLDSQTNTEVSWCDLVSR
jgi:maltose/moltooligosaccharide transporter